MKMKKYEIWFQDSHCLMTILAKDNQEARRIFNKNISIKQSNEICPLCDMGVSSCMCKEIGRIKQSNNSGGKDG